MADWASLLTWDAAASATDVPVITSTPHKRLSDCSYKWKYTGDANVGRCGNEKERNDEVYVK
jgi:hypothetical protein